MEKIQKRVNALKNIQLEIDSAEAKLNEEITQLECKHAPVFDALYKKRETIVNGEREPTEDEAKWEYESGEVVGEKETNGKAEHTNKPGVPEFWLRALEGHRLTKGIIYENDKPILKHLRNIKLKHNSEKPYGFTLEFHFGENEFFKNRVLTKSYEFTDEKDKRNPLMSSHNALYKTMGCQIDWNEGKMPVKEADTDEDDGVGSFFDFFRTHTHDGVRPVFKNEKDGKNGNGSSTSPLDEDDDELEHLFELDYEIGKIIKEMIVPKAVLFYTGDMIDSEDEMDGEFDSQDEDDEEDFDESASEDEPDTKPTKKRVKTK